MQDYKTYYFKNEGHNPSMKCVFPIGDSKSIIIFIKKQFEKERYEYRNFEVSIYDEAKEYDATREGNRRKKNVEIYNYLKTQLPKGYITDVIGSFSIGNNLSYEVMARLFCEIVSVFKRQCGINLPVKMIEEIDEFIGHKYTALDDLKDMINAGDKNCVELAKKIPSEDLCFKLGEYALEQKQYDLAKQLFEVVPDRSDYFKAAMDRVIEINHLLFPECKSQMFLAHYSKAVQSKDESEKNTALRLLADLAGMSFGDRIPFSNKLNPEALMCELAEFSSAVVKENQALKMQIAELAAKSTQKVNSASISNY